MTKQEIPFVVGTVIAARKGRASISQIGAAHRMAARSGYDGIAGELAERMREKMTPSRPTIFTWPAVLLGIAIGVTSNLIARRL